MQQPRPVLSVSGLTIEARIAAGFADMTVASGGDVHRLDDLLDRALASGDHAVISFGLAGGIAASLQPGSVIVADGVSDGQDHWRTDARWRARLMAGLPTALEGRLFGSDRVVARADDKAALRRFGAAAVDMESHVAARLACRYRRPFAAVRIIADPADRSLPSSALVGVRLDGTIDALAVLQTLLRRPAEIRALIRTALDVGAALAALLRCRGPVADVVSRSAYDGAAPGRSGGGETAIAQRPW